MRVIIVGAGWSGCAAAGIAAKKGLEVTLLERTDMLLGTGLVGGIMRNNGRYTATEEMIELGGGDLFQIVDKNLRHENIQFPGHEHACLYDLAKTPIVVERYLRKLGVCIHFKSRINKLSLINQTIQSVTTDQGIRYDGDVFIDATGTSGPMSNCIKYGNGCAMCIMRCPSFGGRISLTALAGLEEIQGTQSNGSVGSMSGSCKLFKESLSKSILTELNKNGVVIVPIPKELQEDHLDQKSCQQYALPSYKENLILLDTGHVKLMTPFYPIEKLRQIPGFEYARYEDPYAASIGNSIRYTSCAHRDNTLKVVSMNNLFCCGEKAGLFVGHTEAIVTGVLAGYNAALFCLDTPLLQLPRTLCTGDAIAFVNEEMKTPEGRMKKYTYSGNVLFERMKQLNLYTTELDVIKKRVTDCGLYHIFC